MSTLELRGPVLLEGAQKIRSWIFFLDDLGRGHFEDGLQFLSFVDMIDMC